MQSTLEPCYSTYVGAQILTRWATGGADSEPLGAIAILIHLIISNALPIRWTTSRGLDTRRPCLLVGGAKIREKLAKSEDQRVSLPIGKA